MVRSGLSSCYIPPYSFPHAGASRKRGPTSPAVSQPSLTARMRVVGAMALDERPALTPSGQPVERSRPYGRSGELSATVEMNISAHPCWMPT